MANIKATMTDIRVIIKEFSRGTSLREMERRLRLSRTSLRNYRDRAEASGRSMTELLGLSDAELRAIMQKSDAHRGRDTFRYAFMQDNLEEYAREMTRKYMTYEVLYEEYLKTTSQPYGYTQFKAIIQEYIKNKQRLQVPQHIRARPGDAVRSGRRQPVDSRQRNGRGRACDSSRMCPSVLDAELCHRHAERQDGISFPGIVRGRQILWRSRHGNQDRQHAAVDQED